MSAVSPFPGNDIAEAHGDKRYRPIFASGVFRCSLDGRISNSAPAGHLMLGYERHKPRGMRLCKPFNSGVLLQKVRETLNPPPASQ